MESTYETTRQETETKPVNVSHEGQISKKALIAFISGALIVFASAIYYCLTTGHAVEGGILAVAFVLIALFAVSVYKSFK